MFNKKFDKKLAIASAIAFTIFIGNVCYIAYQNNIKEIQTVVKSESTPLDMDRIIAEQMVIDNTIQEKDKETIKIIDRMHKMANTKIVAEGGKIWGKIKITKKNIKETKDMININTIGQNELLSILDRWEQGNYDNMVNEHNYLWSRLGGTIGRAIGLKK